MKLFKKITILLLFFMVLTLIPTTTTSAAAKTKYKTVVKTVTKKQSLGKFKITYYCPCKKCSGNWGKQTSTGKIAKEGRTIAVDKRVIPYGTKVKIGKTIYTAEDCGSAIKGKRIDIFMESHKKCVKNGVKYKKVYIIKKVKRRVKVKCM